MRTLMAAGLAVGLVLAVPGSAGRSAETEDFSPYVDAVGGISLPAGFRQWFHLGTWSIAGEEARGGAAGFHSVYATFETLAAYRATGSFPDGAVLVKELIKTWTDDLSTGRASYAAEVDGWFVMIKDSRGRFPDNPLWGNGWGWALFKAGDPTRTVTTDYEADCLPCHLPAEDTDWVYVRGYPVLTE